MRVLVAPDNFKDSLSASEVYEAVENGLKRFDPDIQTIFHPMADGGEGSLAALGHFLEWTTIKCKVHDPLFRPIEASYQISGKTAYIEMAQASGLELLAIAERNCLNTSTIGTGKLIKDAIDKGVDKLYLFIGGSATNDAGIGMAHALGFRFLDQKGRVLQPTGRSLGLIETIDRGSAISIPNHLQVFVVSDVNNILFGPLGATHVYARQKGASGSAVELLENGMKHFSSIIAKTFQKDISREPGSGAAGGMGAGAMIFLNASLVPGCKTIMRLSNFEKKLIDCDLVITGEGRLDDQTIHNKVVYEVAKKAHHHKIPLAIIAGRNEASETTLSQINPWRLCVIQPEGMTVEESIKRSAELIEALSYEMALAFDQQKPV
ncbi:glycerate kinase [Fulvivirgaceae bacterium BMA10]|uniref:Glycerate kinase n=1 Tax=Splendidivirga corallicola TaxID=3051826 RepID=A0ABT8KTV3_9BACT|nr:glycerate kinase [Fulvivirgaceae bacterium BMA10]